MEASALNEVLKDMKGEPFTDGATYGETIIQALTAQLPGDDRLSGKKKFDLFKLAMKTDEMMRGKDDVGFSTGDIETIKERVSAYPPLMVGRIWSMLDPVGAKGDK